jgi:hypothetical protein
MIEYDLEFVELSIFEKFYAGGTRPYRPRKAPWKFVLNTQHLFGVTKIHKHVQCFATKKGRLLTFHTFPLFANFRIF